MSIPDLIERIGEHRRTTSSPIATTPPSPTRTTDPRVDTARGLRQHPRPDRPRHPLSDVSVENTSPSATWTSTNSSSPPARTGSTVVSDARAPPTRCHHTYRRAPSEASTHKQTSSSLRPLADQARMQTYASQRSSAIRSQQWRYPCIRASSCTPPAARAAARRARHPRIPLRDCSDGEPSGCRKRALPSRRGRVEGSPRHPQCATAPLSSVSHSYATPMPAHIPR